MTDPRDPMEDRLRASLARHAADAPSGEGLAERIVHAAERPPAHPSRTWRTWTFPLVAAAAVGVVVLAVIGIENYHPSEHKATPANTGSTTRHVHPVVPPATTSAPVGTPTAGPTSSSPLHGVTILDLTFADANHGWALASANCVRGSGTCTALLRTIDGRTWQSMPGAAFNVSGVPGCPGTQCVTDLRFATDQIGYAFGPTALFMTKNGGASWQQLKGGADALETLNENVIRLVSDHAGCPGPCNLRVETAPIGGTTWTTHALPGGPVDAGTVTLARTGRYALIETSSGQAASLYRVALYLSADGGQSWTERSDPCETAGSTRMATTSVAPAGDGSISVLCQPGGQNGTARTMTSTNGGRTFTAGRTHDFGGPATTLVAASARTLVVVTDRPIRSTDGGRTWQPGNVTFGSQGEWGFAGFESTTVGRVVSPDGRTIWTTRNAGASWTPVTFG